MHPCAVLVYMTVQGMMQQLQSSPHQHGVLIVPGFAMEEAVEETEPLVEAGIAAVSAGNWRIKGLGRQRTESVYSVVLTDYNSSISMPLARGGASAVGLSGRCRTYRGCELPRGEE
jgi:hypothetical protein